MIVFRNILIFGVGLIGGSLSLALRKSGFTGKIAGIDRSKEALKSAYQLGIIDEIVISQEDAVSKADLILIAAPVAQTGAILSSIKPYLNDTTLITDVGSTKSNVVAMAYDVLGEKVGNFIPTHPIAGREKNGPEAAIDDLFAGRKLVITPLPENKEEDINRIASMWKECQAVIHYMTPDNHDNVFALVSHLPHVLSYVLVDQVARHANSDLMFQYAASGFRDFTRIAGSSPEMWRDISMANRKQLLFELDNYLRDLNQLRDMLGAADAEGINRVYTNAQNARQAWITMIEAAEKQRENS